MFNLPSTVEPDIFEIFSKPLTEEISPKSKLAQFKQRYKQFPKVGLKVDVVTDDNGYWKVALTFGDLNPFLI